MNITKHLCILISLISLSTFAQSKKTLNYQAVILDPKAIDIPGASISGQPLNKGNVCLRFSLLNATGGLDYEETQQVTTDEFGLVNVSIGTGSQINTAGIYKSFETIVWNSNVKNLKVSVSFDACASFKQVSTQSFNYTPYALYAEAVDYKNVREAPTKLSQFSNDPGYLIPKDLDPLKADIKSNTTQLQTANQSIADNKLANDAAFLVVNQSLTGLDKLVAQNSSSITTMNSRINDQQNQISDNRNQLGGLQGQLNVTNSTVSNLSGTAEVVSNKSTATDLGGSNPSDQAYPSQRAAKAYVDQSIYAAVGSGVPDATTLAAGKIRLTGDLGGTALNPTVPGLANKENVGNKSTASDLGAGSPSDQLYPSQRATKAYVDNSIYAAVGSGVADATTMAAGKVQLAGDLAGTATSPTVPGLSLKENLSNKSNGALGTSTTLYPTQNAVKSYVDAQIAAATIADANGSTKGKLQLAGDLSGSAAAPTVPGLLLKEDVARKSTATDLGAGSSSDINYPSQKAVKTYVDAQVAAATIADANATTKGKLQLAGDLTGDASAPLIASGAITSAKIQDRSIATDDIADLAITNAKISGMSGSKVDGNIAGNAANVSGIVAVGNGGTGTTSISGYVKGNGSSAMTSVSSIPVSDVMGAVRKVNGTLPNSSGDVTILFGSVSTGTLATRPVNSGLNGDIYIVSADTNPSNDGRTYISDGSVWNEVTANVAATDARYLQLAGGIMDGNLSFPTGKKVIITDAPSGSMDAANKAYVDSKISADAPNATSSVPGKVQLTGDLGGSAVAPTVPGLALKAPINSPAFTGTVTGITKTMVGLANVDNTSDANKPISTLAQTALDLKAPLASPTFSGTVSGITKSMVGLANVDNTTDANKPVSTAAQSALDLKAPLASPTFTGTVGGITKSMVGLANVDNTADADKPVSTAVQTALDFKAPLASPTFTGTVGGITKSMVGLANVDNTTDANKPVSTAAQTALDLKENASNKSNATLGTSTTLFPTQNAVKTYVDAQIASGAPDADATTKGKLQLAGDLGGSAASPTVPGLALKAPIANPTFTGTVAGITKSMVGLANVDNTTDANKPVSTAAQTALDLKENASNKSNASLGTSTILFPTQNAVKTYVDAQVSSATIADADAITKGKLQLAGDLTGTAAAPSIATGVITSAKILDATILTADLADASVTDAKIVGLTGSKVSGNISGNAANVTGTVAIANGGTGSTTQNFVDLTTTQTIGGNKTFSGTVNTSNLNTDNLKVTGGTIAAGSVLISDASGNATWGGTGLYSLNGLTATTHSFAAGTSGTDLTISTSASNGTAIHTFNLPDASAINRGVVTIGAQTFGGAKTFTSDIKVNGLTIGMGASAISSSTAMGYEALNANTTGVENTAVGYRALKANTTGSSNLAFGNNSLKANTTGSNNTAIGNSIMTNSTTGGANTAVGSGALQSNTNNNNTAVGYASLLNNNAGNGNTAVGVSAMQNNVSGTNNTALGYSALQGATGSYNTAIGNGTSVLVGTSTTNATAIGNGAYASASNMIQLGNTSVTSVKTSGTITAGNVTYPNVHNSVAGQILMTDAAGVASWASTRSWTDQPTTVSANQTAFTLTYAPPSTVKVWMFINGVRTNNNAYSVSGTTVTYIPASNGGYTIMASDRVQFDYTY